VRPLETLIGVATGFVIGGVVGLAVIGEIDSTGSHPTRNAALVLLLGSAGALLALLAFVPGPERSHDGAPAAQLDPAEGPDSAPPDEPLPYSADGYQS
jgi:hypothetical protein